MRLAVVHLALLFAACLVGFGSATTYYLSPSNTTWPTTIQNLKAGDTAVLAAGNYELNQYWAVSLSGTSDKRIVVRGAGADATVITQSANQNVLNVGGTFFSFYNMSFTGGSRGVRLFESSSDVLFDGVNIHHTKATGFSANDPGKSYTRLTLRNMEVHHTTEATGGTGECFYLGCQDNKCRVTSSLVELNYCHDTSGADKGYGSGIQLKTGSYNNIIRDNVIYNTNAPGILLYDDYNNGRNLVEGNVVMTTKDNGIQLSSGAIVRNNIVVGAGSYGIYVSDNQLKTAGVYHDVQIAHNTVYSSGSADLRVPALSGSQFVFVNNALFSSQAFQGQTQTKTVWLKNAYVSGTVPDGVNATTGAFQVTTDAVTNVGGNQFYPTSSSPLINAGSAKYSPRSTYDFNGTPRSASTPTVGAYEYTTETNPGGAVGTHPKSAASSNTNPPSSGGADSGAGALRSWITSAMLL